MSFVVALLLAPSCATALRQPALPLRSAPCRSTTPRCSEKPSGSSLSIAAAGLVAQPVVWTSAYFVATTAGGLPAGPYGLLGALEGVSYLAVLGLVGVSTYRKATTGAGLGASSLREATGAGVLGAGLLGVAEGLSYISLGLALLAALSLVVAKGCVPNAEPLLDYSAYVRVCSSDPGLFGL